MKKQVIKPVSRDSTAKKAPSKAPTSEKPIKRSLSRINNNKGSFETTNQFKFKPNTKTTILDEEPEEVKKSTKGAFFIPEVEETQSIVSIPTQAIDFNDLLDLDVEEHISGDNGSYLTLQKDGNFSSSVEGGFKMASFDTTKLKLESQEILPEEGKDRGKEPEVGEIEPENAVSEHIIHDQQGDNEAITIAKFAQLDQNNDHKEKTEVETESNTFGVDSLTMPDTFNFPLPFSYIMEQDEINEIPAKAPKVFKLTKNSSKVKRPLSRSSSRVNAHLDLGEDAEQLETEQNPFGVASQQLADEFNFPLPFSYIMEQDPINEIPAKAPKVFKLTKKPSKVKKQISRSSSRVSAHIEQADEVLIPEIDQLIQEETQGQKTSVMNFDLPVQELERLQSSPKLSRKDQKKKGSFTKKFKKGVEKNVSGEFQLDAPIDLQADFIDENVIIEPFDEQIFDLTTYSEVKIHQNSNENNIPTPFSCIIPESIIFFQHLPSDEEKIRIMPDTIEASKVFNMKIEGQSQETSQDHSHQDFFQHSHIESIQEIGTDNELDSLKNSNQNSQPALGDMQIYDEDGPQIEISRPLFGDLATLQPYDDGPAIEMMPLLTNLQQEIQPLFGELATLQPLNEPENNEIKPLFGELASLEPEVDTVKPIFGELASLDSPIKPLFSDLATLPETQSKPLFGDLASLNDLAPLQPLESIPLPTSSIQPPQSPDSIKINTEPQQPPQKSMKRDGSFLQRKNSNSNMRRQNSTLGTNTKKANALQFQSVQRVEVEEEKVEEVAVKKGFLDFAESADVKTENNYVFKEEDTVSSQQILDMIEKERKEKIEFELRQAEEREKEALQRAEAEQKLIEEMMLQQEIMREKLVKKEQKKQELIQSKQTHSIDAIEEFQEVATEAVAGMFGSLKKIGKGDTEQLFKTQNLLSQVTDLTTIMREYVVFKNCTIQKMRIKQLEKQNSELNQYLQEVEKMLISSDILSLNMKKCLLDKVQNVYSVDEEEEQEYFYQEEDNVRKAYLEVSDEEMDEADRILMKYGRVI